MTDFVVLSSDLQSYVFDTQVKKRAEPSTDHSTGGELVQMAGKADKTSSEGELGTSGGRSCISGLQFKPLQEFPTHPGEGVDVESEWDIFQASMAEAAAQSCGQKVICAHRGSNLGT